MRPKHFTVNAAAVTSTLCVHLVACLHLRDYKRSVPARLLARLLLLMAAARRSGSALAQRCDHAPSDESVRLALKFNLPDQAAVLLDRLLDALHALLPRQLHKRPVPCALDLHLRPYYGTKDTPGVTGGKRAAGTDYFWAYATLVVLVKGLRFNIGLCQVDRQKSLVEAVQALVAQAARAGVRIAWLLLDRGFYDAQVVRYLQQQRLPFALPMIRRGDKEQGTGTQRFFRPDSGAGWYDYAWTARPWQRDPATGQKRRQPGFTVQVRVCVYRTAAGKPWVFVAWGLNWEPGLLAKRYRRRFGIETSYRQLGQCLAPTTSKDQRVRLLLVGLALLLRQVWAWAHYEALAERAGRGRRVLQPGLLHLLDLCMWLLLSLAERLGFRAEVDSPNPLPEIVYV